MSHFLLFWKARVAEGWRRTGEWIASSGVGRERIGRGRQQWAVLRSGSSDRQTDRLLQRLIRVGLTGIINFLVVQRVKVLQHGFTRCTKTNSVN